MGIGEAIAESLSREGANVALISRSEASSNRRPSQDIYSYDDNTNQLRQDKLAAIAKRLNNQGTGGRCVYRTADVGDYDSIDKAIESIVNELGTIDVLINNVCINYLVLIASRFKIGLMITGWISTRRTRCVSRPQHQRHPHNEQHKRERHDARDILHSESCHEESIRWRRHDLEHNFSNSPRSSTFRGRICLSREQGRSRGFHQCASE